MYSICDILVYYLNLVSFSQILVGSSVMSFGLTNELQIESKKKRF